MSQILIFIQQQNPSNITNNWQYFCSLPLSLMMLTNKRCNYKSLIRTLKGASCKNQTNILSLEPATILSAVN